MKNNKRKTQRKSCRKINYKKMKKNKKQAVVENLISRSYLLVYAFSVRVVYRYIKM